MRGAWVLLASLVLAAPAAAGKVKQKAPGPKARGKVYEWKGQNGLQYTYFVPKSYDQNKGANLTFILHGSNLTRYWGFANCPAGTFRRDDIVVSPDGTTANGRGGFNSLGRPEDAQRFRALHQELKQAFRVNATYLYGHSQGSFFALYYAGQYPADVAGVVAHASGVWTQTRRGNDGHHQAIVLMHGTQDPVVPYGQSVGGYKAYREAKYPILRLRSLEGWSHWPTDNNSKVPYTAQQLAWCEGMTTGDVDRVAACFQFLAGTKVKEHNDYAAVYTLARRVAAMQGVPDALKRRATKAMETVDGLAQAHVAALEDMKPDQLEKAAWVGHAALFLRGFMDVPAREKFAQQWKDGLERHKEQGIAHLRKHYAAKRAGNPSEAFAEGVAAIRAGFLHYECADNEFLSQLARWKKDARKLKLPRDAVKAYDAVVPVFQKALKEGNGAYFALNRKAGKL